MSKESPLLVPPSSFASPRDSIPNWGTHLVRVARMAAIAYLGVMIMLLGLENSMIFRPTLARDGWESPPNARVQDVEWHLANGTLIHGWWCPTTNWTADQGAVLYCHGNSGNLSNRHHAITSWQEGFSSAVLIFDYPGFGKSGGKPSEAGCYGAADAAYDWLVEKMQVPPGRILLYGGSLGGGVAVDLATRRQHRALILGRTFTSIPDMAQAQMPWLPGRWLVRNQFNNLAKISRCPMPVFIAHGTADGLVPFSQGERLFAAANQPKEFLPLIGQGHNEGLDPLFFARLRQFLNRAEGKEAIMALREKLN